MSTDLVGERFQAIRDIFKADDDIADRDVRYLAQVALAIASARNAEARAIVEIGEKFAEAHARLVKVGREGKFTKFCEECGVSRQFGYNYIAAYEMCKGRKVIGSLHNIDPAAFRALAKPEVAEEVIAEAMLQAKAGVKVTTKVLNGIIADQEDDEPCVLAKESEPDGETEETAEAEEEVAEVEEEPAAVTDFIGTEVPSKLENAFTDDLESLEELKKSLDVAQKLFRKVASGSKLNAYLQVSDVRASLSDIRKSIINATPYAVCPKCNGKRSRCTRCFSMGWLPQWEWKKETETN